MKRLWFRAFLVVGSTLVALLGAGGVASADTFTVNTTTDSANGTCTAQSCSLRQAVLAADAAGGGTIVVPAGTYSLTIPPPFNQSDGNDPTTGDLDIQSGASVTIQGAGAGATVVDPGYVDRAFAVQPGATLDLSGLTVENGSPSSSSSGSQNGGAVWDNGTLSLSGVTVEHNSTPGKGGRTAAESSLLRPAAPSRSPTAHSSATPPPSPGARSTTKAPRAPP